MEIIFFIIIVILVYYIIKLKNKRYFELLIERDKAYEDIYKLKKEIEEFKLREDNIKRREAEINIFVNILNEIREQKNGSRLIKTFELIKELLNLKNINLFEYKNNKLKKIVSYPENNDFREYEINESIDNSLAIIYSFNNRKIYFTGETLVKEKFSTEKDKNLFVLSLPLFVREKSIGVLEFTRDTKFSRSEISTAVAISEPISMLLYPNFIMIK
ncbi:MAG: hypothetical protein AB1765_00050 [Candidatus Hydrogenedentota bacterium]